MGRRRVSARQPSPVSLNGDQVKIKLTSINNKRQQLSILRNPLAPRR